jgi:hypothetical protein
MLTNQLQSINSNADPRRPSVIKLQQRTSVLCRVDGCKNEVQKSRDFSSLIRTCAKSHHSDRPIEVSGINVSPILHAWALNIYRCLSFKSAHWMTPMVMEDTFPEILSIFIEVGQLQTCIIKTHNTATFEYKVLQLVLAEFVFRPELVFSSLYLRISNLFRDLS